MDDVCRKDLPDARVEQRKSSPIKNVRFMEESKYTESSAGGGEDSESDEEDDSDYDENIEEKLEKIKKNLAPSSKDVDSLTKMEEVLQRQRNRLDHWTATD